MQLPPEIVHLILECLANDPDIDALKACSLTSSSFSKICEPYLYSCIYLYCNDKDGTGRCYQPDPYDPQCRMSLDRLSKTLAVKPHISRHIRRLGILILDPTEDVWRYMDEWLIDVCKIIKAQLPVDQINAFKIYTNPVCNLREGLIRRTVMGIVSSPTLETLHIYGVMNFPLCAAVPLCHKIRHLDVGVATMREWATDDWEDKTFGLTSLIIRPTAADITRRLLGFITRSGRDVLDLSPLSHLRFLDDSFGAEYLKGVIRRCHRLEDLVIAYTYNVPLRNSLQIQDGEPDPIWQALIPVQKKLQNLEIILGRWPPTSYANRSCTLVSFLQLPPTACFTSLATLHLKFLIASPPNANVNVDNKDSNLKDIRESLRNHKAFPSLHSVQITAFYQDCLHTKNTNAWTLDE